MSLISSIGRSIKKFQPGNFVKKNIGQVVRYLPVVGTAIGSAEDAIAGFKNNRAAARGNAENFFTQAAEAPKNVADTKKYVLIAVVIIGIIGLVFLMRKR